VAGGGCAEVAGAHPTCLTQYAARLIREGVVTQEEYAAWQAEAVQKW
jgi:hypothetical protein